MSQIKRKTSIIQFLITKQCPSCQCKHSPDTCMYCNNFSPECLGCLVAYTLGLKKEYENYYNKLFNLETDIPHDKDLKIITCYYDEIIEKLFDTILVCKACI